MLKLHSVGHAQTEWAAHIVLAPKKDKALHLCIAYRKLNAIPIRNSDPLQRMDDCIDSLEDFRNDLALDGSSGYCPIEVDEGDRDKTTFQSHHWIFHLSQMTFEVKSAGGTFQQVVDVISVTLQWQGPSPSSTTLSSSRTNSRTTLYISI